MARHRVARNSFPAGQQTLLFFVVLDFRTETRRKTLEPVPNDRGGGLGAAPLDPKEQSIESTGTPRHLRP
jgi:hypothetical protein